jgi:hypothetical protein
MYDGYKALNMQFNKKVEYIHFPTGTYNVEYQEEQNRGYEYQEDLYVPGYFETEIKKGESIYFTAGLKEINPKTITRKFSSEVEKRIPRNSFIDCLKNAAQH